MKRNFEVRRKDEKRSLATTSAVFLIEFLLPSALSSYGVFFDEFVDDGYFSFHDALWTPIVYISFLNIANPLGRKVCRQFKNSHYFVLRILITVAIILMVIGHGVACFIQNITTQILLYGVLGGTVTGFTLSIIKVYTVDNFQGSPRTFETTLQLARASTIFLLPHLVFFLVDYYNIFRAQALFSVFLLNAIPITLIACRQKKPPETVLSRYKTVPGLYSHDIELPTMNSRYANGISNPMSLRRCSNEDDGDGDDDDDGDDSDSNGSDGSYTFAEVNDEQLELTGPQYLRMKTEMGVEILPEIPEEDETECNELETVNGNIKRLSRMSSKLEEIIDKEEKNSGIFLEVGELSNAGKRRSYLGSRNKNSTGCCSPNRRYLFRRKMRLLRGIVCGCFVKPLDKSFRSYFFYPSFIGKIILSSSYAIYISTITHIALVNGASYKIDLSEAVFLLTFISVAWSFFLISLPWVMHFTKGRLKIIHVFGLMVTSGSFLMIYISQSHDMITVSCLVFGLGYGTISFTEDLVYKESIGPRKWDQVEGTLETLSGIFVIVIYFVIYMFKLSIRYLFLVFFILITFSYLLWILTSLCYLLWTHFRRKSYIIT